MISACGQSPADVFVGTWVSQYGTYTTIPASQSPDITFGSVILHFSKVNDTTLYETVEGSNCWWYWDVNDDGTAQQSPQGCLFHEYIYAFDSDSVNIPSNNQMIEILHGYFTTTSGGVIGSFSGAITFSR
jgi:hypothetical protein